VLRKISDNGSASIPVIVVSGQAAPPADQLDPRIRTWLTKPVTIDEVVLQIESPLAFR
jgi:hypothetical protein